MLKVKMINTGEIKDVTRNVAFGLIDAGKAVLHKVKDKVKPRNKVMTPRKSKGYKIKSWQ